MSDRWRPIGLAAFAAVIWGVWWVPIRWLEGLGLHGAWSGLTMNAGAALAAAGWLLAARAGLRLTRRHWAGAALVGVAVSTYSTSLNHTGVVRAVLLFYLAPVWSKLIEWGLMGLPWRRTTTLALISALSGTWLVLGGAVSPASLGGGDLLAILSGIAWAGGAALVFAGGRASAVSLTAVAAGAAVAIALPFALLAGPPSPKPFVVPAGAVAGAVYVLPIMAMTLWSAQRLTPVLLTFLLTAEILSGVITGAIWAGEPFGPMQAAGAVLIVLAALSEILTGARGPAAENR